MGIAESTYPHPLEWRIEGIDAPLDKVGVRDLTRAFSIAKESRPHVSECVGKPYRGAAA